MGTYEKILFLDVDGVLTTSVSRRKATADWISSETKELLASLINKTGAKIVLTSTWRNDPNACRILMGHLHDVGISQCVVGQTPPIDLNARDQEILSWLGKNPTKQFAILDDDSRAGLGELRGSFFEISSIVGLQQNDVEKAIKHLNSD
ncbi:MAG TPA: HAD domain-containing protein [Phycisphaerae bacterium]|jgi:hypothetical protein